MVRIISKKARTAVTLSVIVFAIFFIFLLSDISLATNFGSNSFANLTIFSSAGSYNRDNDLPFYSNFTNSSGYSINSSNGLGLCQISFNFSGSFTSFANQSFSSDIWSYSRNFSYKGNHTFLVSCNSSFGNVTLYDNFTIINKQPVILIGNDNYINLDGNAVNNDYLQCAEDSICTYNFSANITDEYNDIDLYTYEPTNTTLALSLFNLSSTTGILTINSTLSSESNISVVYLKVTDDGNFGGPFTDSKPLRVNISAVNDHPIFLNLQNTSMTERIFFEYIVNSSDEEANYPLTINISFVDCAVADFSTRNCSEPLGRVLFNFTTDPSLGLLNISFTPGKNDVGNYTLNFSVKDSLNASYSELFRFTVLNNNSDPYFTYVCDDSRNSTEGSNLLCYVNVTDIDEAFNLTLFSTSNLTGGAVSYSLVNPNWFTFDNGINQQTKSVNLSVNHAASFLVNVSLTDANVGNWSVNITLRDSNSPAGFNFTLVNISIKNTNDSVNLLTISNLTLYSSNNYTFSINATDDDLLIPDKRVYNESMIFASNTSWVTFQSQTIFQNTNKSSVTLFINPFLSDGNGNYTIRINVTDANRYSYDEKYFNIQVFSNSPPLWNSSSYTFYLNEGSNAFLPINLTRYVNDSDDGFNINFSYSIDNGMEVGFPRFNLNSSSGIINFTPEDFDVGRHNLTINATDAKGAVSPAYFYFIINNTNDNPNITGIDTLLGGNYTWNAGNRTMFINEDASVSISYLHILDYDLLINNSMKLLFYNETLTLNVTITNHTNGINNFFNFSYSFGPLPAFNETFYKSIFIPRKNDVGNYTVNLTVIDRSGLISSFNFNLTVIETAHPPNITTISQNQFNLSYLESFIFDVNSSDLEDGNDSDGNLMYSLINSTFLSINQTTGMITNNTSISSYSGIWNFSVKVTDRDGLNSTFNVTLFIFDYPSIIYPYDGFEFIFDENRSNQFVINVNHSVQNVLSYQTYINGELRNQTVQLGNGTNLNITIFSNFSEETTCSGKINITLNATNPKLSTLGSWNLTILSSNYPLRLISNFGGVDNSINVTNSLTDQLTDYFTDYDAFDNCTRQNIGFIANKLSGDTINIQITNITNVSGGSITYSSTVAATGNYTITALEYNVSNSSQVISNVTSNNFSISVEIVSQVVEVPSSSGGGGGGGANTVTEVYRPISFKLVLPDPINAEKKDKLVLPLYLENTGYFILNGIWLDSSVVKNGSMVKDINAAFSQNNFTSLAPNQSISVNLSIDINTELTGSFEININASVRSPRYSDWGKIYLTVREGSNVDKQIIFTEELIANNPECAELTELVREAKDELIKGNLTQAEKQIDSAVRSCREAIAQKSKISLSPVLKKVSTLDYLVFTSALAVIIGVLFYSYKRIRLRNTFDLKDKDEFDF